MAAYRVFVMAAACSSIVVGGRLDKKKAGSQSLSSCGTKGASKLAIDRDVHISIVNGRNATECEWRWQVGLRSTETGTPWCGGQLIHPEWVLTAAHCVGAPNFNVVAGEYNTKERSGNEQSRWAVNVIRHPLYDSRTLNWDFALVRLAAPIEITNCVGTVCLPTEGNDVPADSKCWITGWGNLNATGSAPEILQEAEVSILSQEACRNSNYSSSEITDAMICAQGRTVNGEVSDACQGDSGGPLVCESAGKWTVYGATSWGRGCAEKDFPGVWARVHESIEWIEETMEANNGPVPTKAKCPDFAKGTYPDNDGDCQCPSGEYCSVTNGNKRDCPCSGGFGSYGGSYFFPDCADCQCYKK